MIKDRVLLGLDDLSAQIGRQDWGRQRATRGRWFVRAQKRRTFINLNCERDIQCH